MRQRIVGITARPEFWLLALLLWCLLSVGHSLGTPWARVALTEALRWGTGIVLALTLGFFFRRPNEAAQFTVLLAGTLVLLGIAGGFQSGGGGLTGPYQDHQLYGSVLLLLLPFTVAVALTAQDARWRLGGTAVSGAGALCLTLSQTRSAWAGALAAALVFGGLWLFRSQRHRPGRMVLVSGLSLVAGVLGLWLLLAPSDLRTPLAVRAGTLSQLDTDGSWQGRLATWRGAFQMAAAHPLCGIGLGRYPQAQWAWTRIGRPLTPLERPSLSEEAHDFYLQMTAETGVVGLALYGAALTAFIFQGGRRLRRSRRRRAPEQEALVIAALSLIAGQAVDAFASPSWQFAEASLPFWALLGVGLAAMRAPQPEAAAIPLSPAQYRMGRLALSGGAAIALAANILPLGLLTPVEAYTPPAGSVLQSTTVIGSAQSAVAGSTVYFQMVATYKNGSTIYTQNVSTESTTNFGASVAPTPTTYGSFTQDIPEQRVQYVVPTTAKGKTLTISGNFKNGSQPFAPVTQPAMLTVSP